MANVKVDTLQQKMYDIKDIAPANEGMGSWWIYVLIVLAIIGIGAFVYWYVKKRQLKKSKKKFIKRLSKKRLAY